ncbi:MAG: radical SAM protein [Planctomycetota bacterium]
MSIDAPTRVKHRDYTYLGLTQSLCPECAEVVTAKIIARGKRVYFRKSCPTHGVREDFICSDVARYDRVDTSLPAKLPAKTFVEPKRGCPKDCGLCSEHEQHTCIGVVEITDGCNLTCPMCYAASAPGKKHRSLDEVKAAIDRLVEAEGRAEVMQLSGGEPTLHPDLIEALDYALERPIDYVMINTNGIRLANDQVLVDELSRRRDRVEVYFQMDSLVDSEMEQLRGQTGLFETKLKALDRLAEAGLNVTLVATLQGGVNDSAPAELVEFAKSRPEVTGLSFQPATYSGRHVLPEEIEQRITFPDVIDGIIDDPRNQFVEGDFFPLPCAHPNCHWIGLAIRENQDFVPLTKWVDVEKNLDLLANGISFTRENTSSLGQQIAARMACDGGGCCGGDAEQASGLPVLDSSSDTSSADTSAPDFEKFLADLIDQKVGARDVLRITVTSFLDIYNFDVRRVMKCCTHHVLPSGHIIPFCAYNVLYRDGTVPLPTLDE